MDSPNFGEILVFRLVAFFLTLFLIQIIVYFAEHFLIQAQHEEANNVHLLQKQVDYYKNIEIMDKELRRFRHDIKNHFLCMSSLLEKGNIEELNIYFQDLQNSFNSKETTYFSEIHTVSSIDLCTVFSNILSNAIASISRFNEKECTELSIQFQSGNRYFSMKVSNSLFAGEQRDLMKKGKEKPNRNHGFGLYNVKEVIQKCNGTFEQSINEGIIITEIYLPL